MLRYILIFWLVNTYGRSLGIPVGNTDSNGTLQISNLLSDLTKRCKNEFVTNQITLKIKDCSVQVPPFHDVQMQCLMFYDASSLLCNNTVSITAADFSTKTNEYRNVSVFCNEAAHFHVPPTVNQKMISRVFQSDPLCKNVCAAEDVLSVDTHFICKYYKWMLDLLLPPQLQQNISTVSAETVVSGAIQGKPDVSTVNASTLDGQLKDSALDVKLGLAAGDTGSALEIKPGSTSEEKPASTSNIKPVSGSSTNDKVGSTGVKDSSIKVQETSQIHSDVAGDTSPVENKPTGHNGQPKTPEYSIPAGDVADKPELAEKFPEHNAKPVEHAEAPIPEGDDNEDGSMGEGDEGRDGDGVVVGDDDDDPLETDVQVKPENGLKLSNKHADAPITIDGEMSQREFYPNSMSEGFTDDDDHFFPFFLTAVIVVIVLYVLYHNKNKVGKMFFGLIVEGRQSGRRRNSRGHAYRRLDTLEQAMSANTTAPPSKIIY